MLFDHVLEICCVGACNVQTATVTSARDLLQHGDHVERCPPFGNTCEAIIFGASSSSDEPRPRLLRRPIAPGVALMLC